MIKSDGSTQPFDRNKLLAGLMRATIKRDIEPQKLNALIDDIEIELRSRTLTAVSSHEIGDMVLKRPIYDSRPSTGILKMSMSFSRNLIS